MSGGFFEQKRSSPASLAAVVLLHVAVLSAVVMIKGPEFIRQPGPIELINIEPERTPDPEPPPPRPSEERLQPPISTPTIIRLPRIPDLPVLADPPPLPPVGHGIAEGPVIQPLPDPPHVPVRREAEVDRRYAAALQPPYPTAEQRMGREGTVQLRVTIGVDGRVRAVERISATSDDFWRAAERQALTRWRFRPATVDGRPVESTKVMNLRFVLEGQA